jgi:multidrug efflux pump subunit AcrA (membrane-fusion protein)
VTAAYVVVGAEVALRQLRLGRPYGDRIEVLAGLEPGETIALDPVAAGVYVKERAAAGN